MMIYLFFPAIDTFPNRNERNGYDTARQRGSQIK